MLASDPRTVGIRKCGARNQLGVFKAMYYTYVII